MFYKGQKVRVVSVDGAGDKEEKEKFLGMVVTICQPESESLWALIEEDNGETIWADTDFRALKPLPPLTNQEIADKFGVPVDSLVIKE